MTRYLDQSPQAADWFSAVALALFVGAIMFMVP